MNKPPKSLELLTILFLLGASSASSRLIAADTPTQRLVKSAGEDAIFSDQLEQYKQELTLKLTTAWKRESAEIQGGAAAAISGTIDEKGKIYDLAVTSGDPASPAAKRALEVVKLSYLPPVPPGLAEKLPNRRFRFVLEIPLKTDLRVVQ